MLMPVTALVISVCMLDKHESLPLIAPLISVGSPTLGLHSPPARVHLYCCLVTAVLFAYYGVHFEIRGAD
jgi:hypothetical protein